MALKEKQIKALEEIKKIKNFKEAYDKYKDYDFDYSASDRELDSKVTEHLEYLKKQIFNKIDKINNLEKLDEYVKSTNVLELPSDSYFRAEFVEYISQKERELEYSNASSTITEIKNTKSTIEQLNKICNFVRSNETYVNFDGNFTKNISNSEELEEIIEELSNKLTKGISKIKDENKLTELAEKINSILETAPSRYSKLNLLNIRFNEAYSEQMGLFYKDKKDQIKKEESQIKNIAFKIENFLGEHYSVDTIKDCQHALNGLSEIENELKLYEGDKQYNKLLKSLNITRETVNDRIFYLNRKEEENKFIINIGKCKTAKQLKNLMIQIALHYDYNSLNKLENFKNDVYKAYENKLMENDAKLYKDGAEYFYLEKELEEAYTQHQEEEKVQDLLDNELKSRKSLTKAECKEIQTQLKENLTDEQVSILKKKLNKLTTKQKEEKSV